MNHLIRAMIEFDGSVRIPRAILQAVGLRPGGHVTVRALGPGEIIIEKLPTRPTRDEA
jgi:antitoxin component of MazEF toxin-antitoxin module